MKPDKLFGEPMANGVEIHVPEGDSVRNSEIGKGCDQRLFEKLQEKYQRQPGNPESHENDNPKVGILFHVSALLRGRGAFDVLRMLSSFLAVQYEHYSRQCLPLPAPRNQQRETLPGVSPYAMNLSDPDCSENDVVSKRYRLTGHVDLA